MIKLVTTFCRLDRCGEVILCLWISGCLWTL